MNLPLALCKAEHPIADQHISSGALSVCQQLHDAGFKAYLVGGCVRDLLLGLKPKDFDVATDARPEELRGLFRRARIVGRRFKIVHVRFGEEVIEVSTFRTHHESVEENAVDSVDALVCPDSGILLRDNVYGDIEDDAVRRDFTINSLFYDPIDEQILDYTGGLRDLDEKKLQVIGQPEARFREDPVRMIRAIRFMAKLGLSVDLETESALRVCANQIVMASAARMFDEVVKLFMSGNGEASFDLVKHYDLFEHLFPGSAAAMLEEPMHERFVRLALINTDLRIAEQKPVTPAFLYAALLWPALSEELIALEQRLDLHEGERLAEATAIVLGDQLQYTVIPRRFSTPIREIWNLQPRLLRRRRAQRLFEHPRFRAAYDFLLLREQAGEDLNGAGEWWTQFQQGMEPPQRESRRPRRRRRGRRAAAATAI